MGPGEAEDRVMVAQWPADLPQLILRDGYRERLGDGALRSELGGENFRAAEVSAAAPNEVSFIVRVGEDQVESLRNFYIATLGNGCLRFQHPTHGLLRFVGTLTLVPVGDDDTTNLVVSGRVEQLRV